MDRPIWVRLLAVLEHNPESTTVTLNRASAEEMLHEIKRLQDGGCARNQGLTQYCAEAAAMAKDIDTLRGIADEYSRENERLRAGMSKMADAIAVQVQTIERLRAALVGVLEAGVYDSACECISCELARAALTQENTDV
jgi:hypothetical protein